MRSWAKERLSGLLKDVEFDAPESIVTVVKIENLEGDAEVCKRVRRLRFALICPDLIG